MLLDGFQNADGVYCDCGADAEDFLRCAVAIFLSYVYFIRMIYSNSGSASDLTLSRC